MFIYDLINFQWPFRNVFTGCYNGDAAENTLSMAPFIKGFLYEDALVTLKIILFIHSVVLCSHPLNVLSLRGNRDAMRLLMDSRRHLLGHITMTM